MGQFWYVLNTVLLTACTALAFLGMCSHKARADEPGAQALGWIEIEPVAGKTDQIVIVGKVYGLKQSQGRYSMEVKRHERGNVSNGNQSGVFNVGAGENATLSRTSINVPLASSVEIILRLSVGGREIYVTRLAPGV